MRVTGKYTNLYITSGDVFLFIHLYLGSIIDNKLIFGSNTNIICTSNLYDKNKAK